MIQPYVDVHAKFATADASSEVILCVLGES